MNILIKQLLTATILLFTIQTKAQEHRVEKEFGNKADSNVQSLDRFFSKGSFFGHTRTFLMSTINEHQLSDYAALGFGAGMGYESARFKNFQFAISGFFINNVASSNLTKRDPQTNALSRYEVSLFDIEDPANRRDLDRLEELYLRYHFKKSNITFGKQYLNTPFINQQDGRMRPTMENGLWLEVNEIKSVKINAGWITSISPRSTVNWYKAGESIGLYAVGVDDAGNPSGFRGNLRTKGIAIGSVQWQKNDRIKLQAWNYYVDNIFNTAFFQADASLPFKKESKHKWLLGMQFATQQRVGSGGNPDASKAYVAPGFRSRIFSSRAGALINHWELTANYTRITSHGRFLFPREWGREPFHTFMLRERNEGLGNVNAYVLFARYDQPKKNWSATAGAGYYHLPESNDFRVNKYSMPSYYHLLMDIRYRFKGFLKGTSLRMIYLYKGNAEAELTNKRNFINRVDMHHFNLILDYWFRTH